MTTVATFGDACPQLLGLLSQNLNDALPTFSDRQNACGGDDSAAVVIDLDNLLHRGIDRRTGRSRPQATLDIHGFCSALWRRGVVRGTVCRNRPFSQAEKTQWSRFGFATITTGRNCDPDVIKIAKCFANQGIKEIVLVSGDHGYSPMVREFSARNIAVEVWSRTGKLSQELARCAASVQMVDRFLYQPA